MSDAANKQPAPAAQPAQPAEHAAAPKAEKAASRGFSNPALRMMGIPRIKLPSRNWMIFWTVVGTLAGGAAYDKYQQKQLRQRYMAAVEPLGQAPLAVDVLPRRLTVFVAPPPSDFLDESLKLFRRYVKPILNSAAIDFELVTESRQGEIRHKVAEDIRSLRRRSSQQQAADPAPEAAAPEAAAADAPVKPRSVFHWSDNTKSASTAVVHDEDGTPVTSKLSQTLSPLSLLGINFRSSVSQDLDHLQSEDETVAEPQLAGGVICIGRGAYKEYITGVNEGLLGPLDPPAEADASQVPEEEKLKEEDQSLAIGEDGDEDEEPKEQQKIPYPYIVPADYEQATLAPELDLSKQLFLADHRPAYFQQPLVVIRTFSLVGFLKVPERIWRFYNKRSQAQYHHDQTMLAVEQRIRPFDITTDLDLGRDEEADWPAKWVQKGRDKKSLWSSELACDPRVARLLSVYSDHVDDGRP